MSEDRTKAAVALRTLFSRHNGRDDVLGKLQFAQPSELERLAVIWEQLEDLRGEATEVLESIGQRALQDWSNAET